MRRATTNLKKHEDEPPKLELIIRHLGKDFDFRAPLDNEQRTEYISWLKQKMLNYELVWDADIDDGVNLVGS